MKYRDVEIENIFEDDSSLAELCNNFFIAVAELNKQGYPVHEVNLIKFFAKDFSMELTSEEMSELKDFCDHDYLDFSQDLLDKERDKYFNIGY